MLIDIRYCLLAKEIGNLCLRLVTRTKQCVLWTVALQLHSLEQGAETNARMDDYLCLNVATRGSRWDNRLSGVVFFKNFRNCLRFTLPLFPTQSSAQGPNSLVMRVPHES